MRIDILSLFPEMFESVLHSSISGRAENSGLLEYHTYNIRDWTDNKHNKADDYPFGGGAGLVMMIQPLADSIEGVTALDGRKPRRILLTPRGKLLTPAIARELAKEERLLLVCGHYEGLDERVMDYIDEEISIGDYVLTGGELPAMVLVDCLSRFIPGVLGCSESTEEESHSEAGLLEYPQYTRPADFRGVAVPDVLLSGHHKNIVAWRLEKALQKTAENRPDLYERYMAAHPPEPPKKKRRSRKKAEEAPLPPTAEPPTRQGEQPAGEKAVPAEPAARAETAAELSTVPEQRPLQQEEQRAADASPAERTNNI